MAAQRFRQLIDRFKLSPVCRRVAPCPGTWGHNVARMSGSMRRVCLFGVGIVACLTLASCGNGQSSEIVHQAWSAGLTL
jgi:hypothetical protein